MEREKVRKIKKEREDIEFIKKVDTEGRLRNENKIGWKNYIKSTMKKLFVFNGARTLLDSEVSGFRWLIREFGKEQEEKEHFAEYQKVKKEGPWGLPELTRLFEGINQSEIKEKAKKFVKENLMSGAKELVMVLKEKGYFVVFYSSDPSEICNEVKEELELDDVYGNQLEYKDGKATGKLLEKVDRYDRAKKIKKLIEENNLKRESVYIVGNSVTALPSKEEGIFIAFNCKNEEILEQADKVVEGKDLRKILEILF